MVQVSHEREVPAAEEGAALQSTGVPWEAEVLDAAGPKMGRQTGARYMITVGRAAGAATVDLDAPGGVRIATPVGNGWYVIAVPYATANNVYTEIARSRTGKTVGTFHRP